MVNKIQLGPDLCLEERKQYENFLRKYPFVCFQLQGP
jgi:hypothetical protein